MKKLNIALSLAAGLLGGVLSHYVMGPLVVQAQTQNSPAPAAVPQEIRAQRFVLMNDKGEVGGIIGFDTQGGPTIRLYHNGTEIYYAGGPLERPLAQVLPRTEFRAQRYLLMNEKGETAGIIGLDNQGRGTIGLYYEGHELFRAGGASVRPLDR